MAAASPQISLSEAITSLAFGPPVDAQAFGEALKGGQLGPSAAAHQSILVAVRALCDAGFSGEIECFGKTAIAGQPQLTHSKLSRADFLSYRRYVHFEDNLYLGDSPTDVVADDYAFSAAFDAFSAESRIENIVIDRSSFDALARKHRPAPVPPFTDAERKTWIREQEQMSADSAHKLYSAHPRCDRVKQRGFRNEWRSERKTTRGRPRKNA